MTSGIQYVRTVDGDEAVRIAHLVMALVPTKGGGQRVMTAWPARDPATCTRSDFHPGGFRATDRDGFHREAEEYARHHEDLAKLGRKTLDRMRTRSLHSPWGTPDNAVEYGEGLISVDTPEHGGYLVPDALNQEIHEAWRSDVGLDGYAFYEEDCESSIVRFSIPRLFTTWECANDVRNLREFMPDQWETVTGTVLLPGQSTTRDRGIFLKANEDRYVVTSASYSKLSREVLAVTAYRGGRDARGGTSGSPRTFLIPADVYEGRRNATPGRECLIEPGDQEIDRNGDPVQLAA
jgi:hypothetical protein